ncbi:axonemal dynein light chain domain-containing protein 1 [Eucyclogobius newberryi]|uniref:axonemal dynein light chain domain-containing protein 1 n=1 Tax=Eucyclogobius newberryi TaxID=166745 RepID=UPI003B5A473D
MATVSHGAELTKTVDFSTLCSSFYRGYSEFSPEFSPEFSEGDGRDRGRWRSSAATLLPVCPIIIIIIIIIIIMTFNPLFPVSAEITKTHLPSARNAVIPEELLVSLTSTVCHENGLMPSAHQRHCQGCTLRRPDPVWHHSLGRKKHQHFLEQPTSLSGAGRDISFLCDAAQRKTVALPPLSEKPGNAQTVAVGESLIPDEYHVVRNKGLRSLELYEDAFTVTLQDDEQKLRVFPSMKPSGRQEVLQLLCVMDDMLEKAGVEQQSEELEQLSQIEGLLDLVRTEQNIYNVVFHELIRQVSVGCAERGQLLAKLRQRYQSLLDRIPHYLKALHTEAVAQRALDRRLTVEIHHIKTSIQQLSRELAKIKAHDAFVSQQAERAQHELADALSQTQNNSEVVQRYHELYELQRGRLNAQLLQMSEERDLWSHFTYSLALKVISVKDLQLVSQLHASEEAWHKTAQNCSIYINAKDSEDLKSLSDMAELWREDLRSFTSRLKRRDRAQCEVICPIQPGIAKWLSFCSTQRQNNVQKCPRTAVEEINADFKTWSKVAALQTECFHGDAVLAHTEALEKLVTVRDGWLSLSLQLLQRHSSPDRAPSQLYQTFTELQSLLSELHAQLGDHITGENGVHTQLQSLSDSIGPWLVKVSELKEQLHKALDLDHLEKSLTVWQSLVENILQLILGAETEEQVHEPGLYTETNEVAHRVKVFVETLCSFIDGENQSVSREITGVHGARTRWMLDLLLVLVPDLDGHRENRPGRSHGSRSSVPQLEDDAALLSQRVERLSIDVTRIKDEMADREPERALSPRSPVVQMISSNRRITRNKLGQSQVQLSGSEEQAEAPVTEEAQKAFTDLSIVGLLQQELLDSEEQVQSAERRAQEAEEALQTALQKILDLERRLQGRSRLESPGPEDVKTPEPSSSAAPLVKAALVKKTPESKPQTGSRKTRKR